MDILRKCNDMMSIQRQIDAEILSDSPITMNFIQKARDAFTALNIENNDIRNAMQNTDYDKVKMRQEVKELKGQLTEARSQIAALMSAKHSAEAERDKLEKQVEVAMEIVADVDSGTLEKNQKRLEFLNYPPEAHRKVRPQSTSVLSENEFDYDRTDDDLEGDSSCLRGGKKWKRSSITCGKKRSRSATRIRPTAPPIEEETEPVIKRRSVDEHRDRVELFGSRRESGGDHRDRDASGGAALAIPEPPHGRRRSSMNKSMSEPHLAPSQASAHQAGLNLPFMTGSTMGLSPALNINTPNGCLSSRRHLFFTRTNLKPETCDACGKRIQFGKSIIRCQNCKTQCHTDCRELVTLPCIARGTPSRSQKSNLTDFVPQSAPMIPHVLIHCINEIERRGFDYVGIYRVPGTESKVSELLEKFLFGKGVPNLRLVDDVFTIAGCVKKFLQQLKEPLIPTTSWNEFVRAAESKDAHGRPNMQALHRAIADLPLPNKDTLSFVVLHLQRIALSKEQNKMSIENLARVFGPTVVGYSIDNGDLQQCLQESSKQEIVMTSLLNLPMDYWARLINSGDTLPLILESNTPEVRPAPTNLLGLGATPTSHFGSAKYGSGKAKKNKFFRPLPPWK